VSAKDIEVERGLNTRFFYNEVLFQYNYSVLTGQYNNTLRIIDADAQARMDQVSVLEIACPFLDDSPYSVTQMTASANRLLQRYKYSAETISLSVFFGTGHTIDAGDVVVLTDAVPPVLQIANTETGTRGVYDRIMEVQERSIDVSGSRTKLKLLSNNGFSVSDRYGVVGPSSLIDGTYPLTSSTQFKIKDSFGAIYPGAEYLKWSKYVGSKIRVHNSDYTIDEETYFTLDPGNQFVMLLDPALSFTPTNDMIVEFSKYDQSSALVNSLVKQTFVALDPSSLIASGSSSTVFVLQTGLGSLYKVGQYVYVHNDSYTFFSSNVVIDSIVGDIITIRPSYNGGPDLGFTPASGYRMELAGFLDGGAGYKLI
jgi:hypothetical protein